MKYLAQFFIGQVDCVNSFLPTFHRCKLEEHLLHPQLDSIEYLFPIRNSSGDDSERRYCFLRKKTGPFLPFHTLLRPCDQRDDRNGEKEK